MKMTMRIGALLLVAALTAACGSDSEPSQSQDGSTAAGGNGSGSNKGDSEQGNGEGKKKNKNKEHHGSGSGGGDNEPEPVPKGAIVVEVKAGTVSGVEDTVEVAVGDRVVIVVNSDKADEVHVHGYDEFDKVGPKERAEIEFTADIPGVFEVELEHAVQHLFELQVQ